MKTIGLMACVILMLTATPALSQTVSKDGKIAAVRPKVADKKVTKGDVSGLWWRTSAYVKLFSLTIDQQQKMDDVFQEARVRLITLDADLRVQEAMLEPLMAAERLDEAKTLAQIDRVATARAELEKANARMLLGIRQAITSEQWAMLQKAEIKIPDPTMTRKKIRQ